MQKLFLILILSFAGLSVQAQDKTIKKNKNAQYTFEVNGNCNLCKKRIEKAAYSVKGVKMAQWHVDHGDIHVTLDENKASIDDVHKAIIAVGHDTNKMKADDKVYEELHSCCKYDRLK